MLLESLIEKYPNELDFIGIGSKQEEIGLCQNCGLDWYKRHYKVNSLSSEDLLAFAYLRNPHYQMQKKFYEKMLAWSPNNYKILFGLSIIEHNQGKLEEALSLYQKVIILKPLFSKAYQQIAFIYYKKDISQQAIKYSKLCLKVQPRNIFALFVSVNFLWEQDQIKQTIEKILQIQPQYSRAINQLGNLYFRSENYDYEDAIQQYTACISLNKKYLTPIINIGKCYVQLEQYDTAVKTLLQVENLPKSKDEEEGYCLYLSDAYSNMRRQNQSIKLLRRCLQINPSNEDAHLLLGQVYIKLLQYKEALKIYKNMLAANKSSQAYSKIIQVLDLMKDYCTVTYWLRRWQIFQPNSIRIHALFADNYYKNSDWNQCVIYCKKCIDKKHQVDKYYGKSIVALEKMNRLQQLKKQIKLYVKQCDLSWEEMERMSKLGAKIDIAQKQKKGSK